MIIAINTISVDGAKGGIRIFLTETVRRLVEDKKDWRFDLLVTRRNAELFQGLCEANPHVRLKTVPLGGQGAITRILADQLLVPRAARQADVLLTPSNVASVWADIPQVVIIQAPLAIKNIRALPFVPPGLVSRFHRIYYDWGILQTLEKAAKVVAVSKFLRDKMAELYPRYANSISVVHEGTSFVVRERGEAQPPGDYLLFVSSLFPYKNADKLLAAFALLKRTRDHFSNTKLVFCGKDPDGRQLEYLQSIAEELGVTADVDFKGQVPHEELADLYSRCSAFVYPSSVETFGLPVLEAMASGAPVICSDKMSVPEVAGDAAVVVDPLDVESLANGISSVVENPEHAERLRQRGYRRIENFTWKRCAQGVAAEIERARTRSR